MYLRLDNPGIEKVAFNQIIKFFIQYTGKNHPIDCNYKNKCVGIYAFIIFN